MKSVDVWLQKRGFAINLPITRNSKIDWDALTDALLRLPNVSEVDGPVANGAMGVFYDDDDRPDAMLIAEIKQVCERFVR
jgi:hypothetical protein